MTITRVAESRSGLLESRPVTHRIVQADNLDYLPQLEDASFDLIYIDPPFNTGREQRHTRVTVERDDAAARVGFGGRRYRMVKVGSLAFADSFDDFLAYLEPRLMHAHRLLKPTGSFFLHLDPRESHYCKVLLDSIFGRDNFLNEIVWSYDFGGRPRNRWPTKHDVILWYVKHTERYTFNYDAIDRIPYMAPGLVGAEKAARGKTPTDVWWQTIVPTSGRERTGYPTQKPLRILERIVLVHSNPGDSVLDFFAGSGTLGEAAALHGRQFTLIDRNPEAIEVMRRRLSFATPELVGIEPDAFAGPNVTIDAREDPSVEHALAATTVEVAADTPLGPEPPPHRPACSDSVPPQTPPEPASVGE